MTVTESQLQVSRWRKYGKDRLYVSTKEDRKVGWLDLLTGQQVLELEVLRLQFEAAVQLYCREHALPSPVAAGAAPPPIGSQELPVADAAGTAAEDSWLDLSTNQPGQGVRAQADAALADMKQRSLIRTAVTRVRDSKTQERAWRVGADGEELVGDRLDRLRKHGWHVLHSVPVGRGSSDIDHLLVGPGGVFTVNTKRHPNKEVVVNGDWIRVAGSRKPYVHASRHEALRAGELLTASCGFPVVVRGVLVFSTATLITGLTIKKEPHDVLVLARGDVPRRFRRADEVLAAEQVQAIYARARRSTTWTT